MTADADALWTPGGERNGTVVWPYSVVVPNSTHHVAGAVPAETALVTTAGAPSRLRSLLDRPSAMFVEPAAARPGGEACTGGRRGRRLRMERVEIASRSR